MADATQAATATTLNISDDIRARFPDVVELIVASESMNDSERQYWINILQVMTPEQIQSLRDILTNERTQLQAIDQKYSQTIPAVGDTLSVEALERDRQEKAQQRRSTEETNRAAEMAATTDLLSKIEGGQA